MFKKNNVMIKLSTFLLVLAPVLVNSRSSGTMVGEPKLPAKLTK